MSFTTHRGSSFSIDIAAGSAFDTKISITASIGGSLKEEDRHLIRDIKKEQKCLASFIVGLRYLRLSVWLQSLDEVADRVIDQEQVALTGDVK